MFIITGNHPLRDCQWQHLAETDTLCEAQDIINTYKTYPTYAGWQFSISHRLAFTGDANLVTKE
jgi:hypothetical protein